jgi:hypothetical protein
LVPLVRLIGDVAKMLGYPAGLLWRLPRPPALPDSEPPGYPQHPT